MTTTTTTATATATATYFARTSDEISDRLDAWVASQQICTVVLPTSSGVCADVLGRLNTRPGGHESYILHSSDLVTNVTFPLSAVEAVGAACIFLRAA